MDNLDSMFGSDDENEGDGGGNLGNRPESCGVLKFHNGTEDALYHYVANKATQGDVSAILKTIDEFCYTQHWMMHIGDKKLQYLLSSLDTARVNNPREVCVAELGSYCGYSAIYLGSLLDKNRGDHLYCIEADPKCVGWTRRMVQYAGLNDVVTVVACPASDVNAWRSELFKDSVDLLFIDHAKSEYLNDLVRIEQAGLLKTGAVVVADNVLSFGVPLTDYLNHVRDSNGLYSSSTLHEGFIEYASGENVQLDSSVNDNLVDGVEISIYK